MSRPHDGHVPTTEAAPCGDDGVVLCVGEALIALTPTRGSLREAADLAVSPAGAELNVAVHLARLGLRSRFAGRVGDDPFGQRLRDALQFEGVDDGPLEVDPDLPTGLYAKDPSATDTAVLYYRRDSAATRLRTLPPGALAGVGLVHLSGITPALSPECDALVTELLDTPGLITSFDVNHRPALWSAEEAGPKLLELAARATTVFVGLDEAARLWDVATAADVRDLLPDPVELVVKDGATAATAFTPGGTAVEPALPVQVVEPVGAGDAFAAGYLASRRRGEPADAALRRGHELAAQVLTSHSDNATPPRGSTVAP
ncbi:sugar kinase [Nitriliruptor alkaliphilus]|uniref:sugar kinase n=1 Tax=Nitriliruptor alkaliphilus TaxID=427918 RepID=UPI00069624F9|nr:sugar kinase [Nitriliruptor alkaliphilus]